MKQINLLKLALIIIGLSQTALAQCPVTATPAISISSICAGDSLTITDNSASVDVLQHSYWWDFNNDSIADDSTTIGSITLMPPSSGMVVVTLTIKDTAGCASSVTDTAWVSEPAQASVVMDRAYFCLGDTVHISNQTTGASGTGYTFAWDFNNDGLTDDSLTTGDTSLVPMVPGMVVVSLTVSDSIGCSAVASDSAIVVGRATPNFSVTNSCPGDSMQLVDSSTGIEPLNHRYIWDLNEDGITDDSTQGGFSFIPTLTDTFTISLTLVDTFGCSASALHPAIIFTAPVVRFTASQVCRGAATLFTDSSTQLGNNPTYAWDVNNDAQTDTTIAGSFAYTYPLAGIYVASLHITNEWGCSARDAQIVIVGSNPIAKFGSTVATSCISTPVQFLDSSLLTTAATQYVWDYNNDGISDNTHPGNTSYYYGSVGTGVFTVKLKLINEGGCTDSAYRLVTITPSTISVNAGSDKSIICSGTTALSAVASRSSGVVFSWSPIQNLSNPSIANPNATPDTTTFYVVTATYSGCSALDTVKVDVAPIVLSTGIDQTIVCGSQASLTSSSNISSGLLYNWYPTTGLSNYSASTTLATPLATTQYVLTVTKGTCKASDTVTVEVSPILISAGSDKNINCGSTVTLTTSVNATGLVYEWWPTNDLNSFTVASPIASPTDTTLYVIKATKSGCEARDSIVVNVTPFEVFAGSDKTITCGTTAILTTSINGVTAPLYSWTPAFGLSNPFVSNPTVTAAVDTSYVVTVTKGLCLSRDTIKVLVSNKLPIAFTANKTSTNQRPYAIKFTNQTTNINNYNYTWLFGDGGSSTQTSPTYVFANPGTYDVSLVAQSLNGSCIDTLEVPGYINCMVATALAEDVNSRSDMLVYPNPTKGAFSITLKANMSGGSIAMYTVNGQQILTQQLGTTHDDELLTIEQQLGEGMYMMVIRSEQGLWTGRLLVQ
jgi:PKD repeat protein